jgi:hypothetical protein
MSMRSSLCVRAPRRGALRQDPLRQPQQRGQAGAIRAIASGERALGRVSLALRIRSWYCQPGHDGSHEKGRVEGEGGRFRRNHCVPMPVIDSIGELNALLAAADDVDDNRRIANRANSVGQDWEFEKTLLRPLPGEPFDTTLTLTPRVDRYAEVMVRCNQYSVPARFIGHRLRVKLSAWACHSICVSPGWSISGPLFGRTEGVFCDEGLSGCGSGEVGGAPAGGDVLGRDAGFADQGCGELDVMSGYR